MQDIQRIVSYGVMASPVFVNDEQIVMVDHRGSRKIEELLKQRIKA